MSLVSDYEAREPSREEVDALHGATLLEFGNAWCGHCRAAQPLIAHGFQGHEGVRHIKIADGSGRRLGRSFRVKLWPTLVFLRDGDELARLVRPHSEREVAEAFARIDSPTPGATP